MRTSTILLAWIALLLIGCVRHRVAATGARHDPLLDFIGQRVTLIGVAEPRKMGAALRGDTFYVWIEGLHDWPTALVDQRVQVIGVLEERHDLPVFVERPDELPMQGLPVPEGTDLHRAGRRYVLTDARWSVSR